MDGVANQKVAFEPVADNATRVLLLGSLPGEISLARKQYYANRTNQFWRLVGPVVEVDLVELDYEARLTALLKAGIGLWDVVRSADRRGSLDFEIKNLSANRLAETIQRLPNLRAAGFNGGKAYQIGRKQLEGKVRIPLISLPSSSAAYCAMPFETKLNDWLRLKTFLV